MYCFSTIANWRSGARPVSDVDAQAAEALWQLVGAGEVVLPLSASHLVETGALYGDRRVAQDGIVERAQIDADCRRSRMLFNRLSL